MELTSQQEKGEIEQFDLRKLPALRLLIVASLFLLIGSAVEMGEKTFLIVEILFLAVGALLRTKSNYTLSYIILASAFGLYIGFYSHSTLPIIPQKTLVSIPTRFSGKIDKVISSESTHFKVVCSGNACCKAMIPLQNIRSIVYIFKPNQRCRNLLPGTTVSINGSLRFPQEKILPTDFDEQAYARSNDIQTIITTTADNCSVITEADTWSTFVFETVNDVKQRVRNLFPDQLSPLIIALLLGDKSELSTETINNYSVAGTIHVLAVSGLHVGLVSVMIFIPLGFISNRYIKSTLFVFLLVCFLIATGAEPSAVRAAVMAILYVIAHVFQRKPHFLNVLLLTVVVLLAAKPSLLYSIGFQMSFVAVLGIAVFYQRLLFILNKLLHKVGANYPIFNYLVRSIGITVAASSLVGVLTSVYFGTLSIIGVIANIAIVPLTSIAMVFAFLAVLTSYIVNGVAELYTHTASFFISVSDSINNQMASIPYAALHGQTAILVACFIAIGVAYLIFANNRRVLVFRTTVIVLCSFCIFCYLAVEPKQTKVHIVPRPLLVMAETKLNEDTTFVLLVDRKPHQEPIGDIGLEKYLEAIPNHLVIGKKGNVSEWISVKTLKKRKAEIIQIDDSTYRKIVQKIKSPNLFAELEEKIQ